MAGIFTYVLTGLTISGVIGGKPSIFGRGIAGPGPAHSQNERQPVELRRRLSGLVEEHYRECWPFFLFIQMVWNWAWQTDTGPDKFRPGHFSLGFNDQRSVNGCSCDRDVTSVTFQKYLCHGYALIHTSVTFWNPCGYEVMSHRGTSKSILGRG